MPRKGAKNDHVSLVRSRLPQFASLSREKIELALLYYDSDVDATVQAFERGKAALFSSDKKTKISFIVVVAFLLQTARSTPLAVGQR